MVRWMCVVCVCVNFDESNLSHIYTHTPHSSFMHSFSTASQTLWYTDDCCSRAMKNTGYGYSQTVLNLDIKSLLPRAVGILLRISCALNEFQPKSSALQAQCRGNQQWCCFYAVFEWEVILIPTVFMCSFHLLNEVLCASIFYQHKHGISSGEETWNCSN